jgi:hypothetical protein
MAAAIPRRPKPVALHKLQRHLSAGATREARGRARGLGRDRRALWVLAFHPSETVRAGTKNGRNRGAPVASPTRRFAPAGSNRSSHGVTKWLKPSNSGHKDLAPYLLDWRGYFGFCQTPRVLTHLEAWIRRRLRAYLWRQWQNGPNRFTELRRRGLPKPRLTRSNRRGTDPYARWCGRGGAARHPPIPINPHLYPTTPKLESSPAGCGPVGIVGATKSSREQRADRFGQSKGYHHGWNRFWSLA